MIPTLSEHLESLGREYAPFDPLRMPRIYEALKVPCGFEMSYGQKREDGFKHGHCRIIHIIGTNGKGSTGRFITMGLEQNKKRVLHFSSPHLFDFKERFYLNGGVIDSEMLEKAHRELYSFEISHKASYFEYATLLALLLAKDCEFLVLEAGLGGEFDSTNVLWACVSVFTPIGLDHQEFLGNTLKEIATTKLRAMKSIALLGKQEAEVEHLTQEIAAQKGAKCYLWQERESSLDSGLDTQTSQSSRTLSLKDYATKYALPPFLRDNLALAQKTLELFGMDFDFGSLAQLTLRGRCERIAPNVIIDVGHNLPAARALKAYCMREFALLCSESRALDTQKPLSSETSLNKLSVQDISYQPKRLHLVYNSYADKDIEAILSEFLPIIKKVLIISVENSRICPGAKLIEILEKLGLAYEDFTHHSFREDELYLVFGSFSVIDEFLRHYKEENAK